MSDQKSVLAWHFVRANRKLGYDDNNTVAAGYVYEVDGPLEMCRWGLHASRSVWGAMYWAPGSHICRVRCSGKIIEDPVKLVARRREVLWIADATSVLDEFSCWFAEEYFRRLRARGVKPHKRLREVVAIKRAWIRGRATTRQLNQARMFVGCAKEFSSSDWETARIVTRATERLGHTAGWRLALLYKGQKSHGRRKLHDMIMALKPK